MPHIHNWQGYFADNHKILSETEGILLAEQEKVNSVLKVVYGVGWMLHSVS